jgi:hypothetical protein
MSSKEIRSAHRNFGARQLRPHFGQNAAQLRIEPQAGFPRPRNLCRQEAPLGTVARALRTACESRSSRLAAISPSGNRPSFSFPRERTACAGASSTRFALTQPAKSSNCSTVSRATGASLIVRPSPRPFAAPLTAQLRLSRGEADPTCEHHRNRAGEGVLVLGMNLRAGEHLLRNSSSYT